MKWLKVLSNSGNKMKFIGLDVQEKLFDVVLIKLIDTDCEENFRHISAMLRFKNNISHREDVFQITFIRCLRFIV